MNSAALQYLLRRVIVEHLSSYGARSQHDAPPQPPTAYQGDARRTDIAAHVCAGFNSYRFACNEIATDVALDDHGFRMDIANDYGVLAHSDDAAAMNRSVSLSIDSRVATDAHDPRRAFATQPRTVRMLASPTIQHGHAARLFWTS
jgi:hypothetical protein